MMIVSVLAGVLFVTMAVNASTTISTNVSTDGTLDVTGLTTLTGASTTRISLTGNLMVNGMATTTGSTGSIATEGNLTVLGTASTTALKVGATANTITDASVGICVPTTNPSIAASTTAMVACTSSVPLSSSDRIFVQATSSLASNFVIQAASSTSATNIQIRILNVGLTTSDAGDVISGAQSLGASQSFNIWAVR